MPAAAPDQLIQGGGSFGVQLDTGVRALPAWLAVPVMLRMHRLNQVLILCVAAIVLVYVVIFAAHFSSGASALFPGQSYAQLSGCRPRDGYTPSMPPGCPDWKYQLSTGSGRVPAVVKSDLARMQGELRSVAESMQSLPEPRYKTCAVVGNSGVHLTAKMGREIDAHDMVMRVNLGPTWGFEDHVGSRTTHRIAFPPFCAALAPQERVRNLCVRCFDTVPNARMCKASHAWMREVNKETRKTHEVFYADQPIPDSVLVPLAPQWMSWVKKMVSTPSTGLYAVMYAREVCDRIDLYGFALGAGSDDLVGEEDPESVRKHSYAYFRDTSAMIGAKRHLGSHSDQAERCVLVHLAQQGVLRDRYPFCSSSNSTMSTA